jgi:hypothetical protein
MVILENRVLIPRSVRQHGASDIPIGPHPFSGGGLAGMNPLAIQQEVILTP